MLEYLSGLSEPQKEAVLHLKGPLLVIAGAGAGKTRVITHRIAHLIQKGVAPEHILAVTFTNKAAGEMKERVRLLQGTHRAVYTHEYATPFVGTFHSLGVSILREKGHIIGIPRRFIIKDKNDSRALLKEAIKDAGVDRDQFSMQKIQGVISKAKGNALTRERYAEMADGDYFPTVVSDIWERYETRLKKERALDFDDLLMQTVLLLSEHDEVRALYQNKWRYVHIDEYQDTNKVQYLLSKLLVENHNNICVVGDDSQNIYSWRGADIGNILRFEKNYPNAKTVFLEENYRSTRTILEAANRTIEKNTLRIPKELFTKKSEGEKISLSAALNEKDEARGIADTVCILARQGETHESIAVLYRANFQSRVLEEAFLAKNIPYQIIGTRFFERREVKDMIAFIHAARNPESLSDLKRIVNVPPRGVGKVTIAKMFSGKRESLAPAMKARVDALYALLERIRAASLREPPSSLLKYILKESKLEKHLKNEWDDGVERLENIKELVTFASRYDALPKEEALEKFLEDVALASDQDALKEKKKGVKLMTVHAAKGLEFPYVFICGLEQGLFPHERERDELISENIAEHSRISTAEEERRLFYVALTRAQQKVFLSYAQMRTVFGSLEVNIPSEFIADIPEHLIEVEDMCAEGEYMEEIEYD